MRQAKDSNFLVERRVINFTSQESNLQIGIYSEEYAKGPTTGNNLGTLSSARETPLPGAPAHPLTWRTPRSPGITYPGGRLASVGSQRCSTPGTQPRCQSRFSESCRRELRPAGRAQGRVRTPGRSLVSCCTRDAHALCTNPHLIAAFSGSSIVTPNS